MHDGPVSPASFAFPQDFMPLHPAYYPEIGRVWQGEDGPVEPVYGIRILFRHFDPSRAGFRYFCRFPFPARLMRHLCRFRASGRAGPESWRILRCIRKRLASLRHTPLDAGLFISTDNFHFLFYTLSSARAWGIPVSGERSKREQAGGGFEISLPALLVLTIQEADTMRRLAAIILATLFLCSLPTAAVILEVTVRGTVSGTDKTANTLTIAGPAQYGCSYPASGQPVCSYSPMANATLTGTVPADSAFSVFSAGDTVVATSTGGAGGTWIALGKLTGPGDDSTVTGIVGDPAAISTPLAGGYSLELLTEPDCTTCSGTTCTAASSSVRVMSGTTILMAQDLAPGHAMTYNGRNDGSSVGVTFVKGQASSSTCAGRAPGMTGPQPISVYLVHVVPPIGSVTAATGTVTGSPLATRAGVTTPAGTPPATAKSGLLPFAAIGALAFVAATGIRRR